ncbi:MAG: hypothetical protein H0T62_07115 [Parachlamydiaceae bacterium]|nr:hypothetical protein [Parachlamydiaceae bacterium]
MNIHAEWKDVGIWDLINTNLEGKVRLFYQENILTKFSPSYYSGIPFIGSYLPPIETQEKKLIYRAELILLPKQIRCFFPNHQNLKTLFLKYGLLRTGGGDKNSLIFSTCNDVIRKIINCIETIIPFNEERLKQLPRGISEFPAFLKRRVFLDLSDSNPSIIAFCYSMPIYVKTLTGATLLVDAKPQDSIDNIKQKIQDISGVPPDQQSMKFKGKYIQDGKTLSNYNIVAFQVIHLVPLLRGD